MVTRLFFWFSACNLRAGYYSSVRHDTITIFGWRRKPKEVGPVLRVLVFLPLLAIAALVSLPFIPIAAWWQRRRRSRLKLAMNDKNRVMRWVDFARALEEKRGTLIVEGDPRKGPNFWWTPDDVLVLSPEPCSDSLGKLFNHSYEPFREWCYRRYTGPSGNAFLVVGGKGQHKGFSIDHNLENDFRGKGMDRDIPTVFTTYPRRRWRFQPPM